MAETHQQQLQSILLQLLPADHSGVGSNGTPVNRTVAVKIVDDRGIESLKVMRLDAPG